MCRSEQITIRNTETPICQNTSTCTHLHESCLYASTCMKCSGPSSSARGPVGFLPDTRPRLLPLRLVELLAKNRKTRKIVLVVASAFSAPAQTTQQAPDIDDLENSRFHPSSTYACKGDRAHTVALGVHTNARRGWSPQVKQTVMQGSEGPRLSSVRCKQTHQAPPKPGSSRQFCCPAPAATVIVSLPWRPGV